MPSSRVQKNHPISQVITDDLNKIQTRIKERVNYRDMVKFSKLSSECALSELTCFVCPIEPKNVQEALKDDFRVNATHEELHQFERDNVRTLVPGPAHINVI